MTTVQIIYTSDLIPVEVCVIIGKKIKNSVLLRMGIPLPWVKLRVFAGLKFN